MRARLKFITVRRVRRTLDRGEFGRIDAGRQLAHTVTRSEPLSDNLWDEIEID